jgi:hypothetical protein
MVKRELDWQVRRAEKKGSVDVQEEVIEVKVQMTLSSRGRQAWYLLPLSFLLLPGSATATARALGLFLGRLFHFGGFFGLTAISHDDHLLSD